MAPSISSSFANSSQLRMLKAAGTFILALTGGLAGSHLVVTLGWQLIAIAVVAVPATVLLFRRPAIGIAMWIALAPLVMLTHSALGRKLYWLLHRGLPVGVLALLVLLWLSGTSDKRARANRPFPFGWPELAMTAYAITGLVSIALLHESPASTSILFFDRVLVPMCLYLAIRLWRPDEKDFAVLLTPLLFMAISQSVIGALSWLAPGALPPSWLNRPGRTTGSLVSPSIYAVALLFAGTTLFHAGRGLMPAAKRTLHYGAAIGSLFFTFLTLSRAAWLAEVLVLVGLCLIFGRQVYRWSLAFLPLVVVLGFSFSEQVTTAIDQRAYSSESLKSAASRVPVYMAGIRMFLAEPVWGWGYGNFDRFDRRFQVSIAGIQDDNRDHASHNFYLTLLAEQGLLGIAFYLFPALWWLVRSLKFRERLPKDGLWSRKLLGVLWLSVMAHLVVNQFSNMREGYGLGLWWLTLGLIAALVEWGREKGTVNPTLATAHQ